MAEMDNSIAQRHAEFHTLEQTIFDLVKEHTGCAPVKRTKIIRGYDSEVYDVSTKEQSSFIVKLKHYGEISYYQEAWAMEMCRTNGVPVPRTYAVGSRKIVEQEREYMIQEKAPGRSLAERIETLSPSQIHQVLRNAGELLRRMHQVKVGGFYQRHQDATWDFASWKSLGDANIRDRAKEMERIIQVGFSSIEGKAMLHYLQRYRDEFTCEQLVLCHGDYVPEHIFLDEDLHICALLDFGMFQGNHPIHDIAYFNSEFPSQPLQALLEGYGDHEMFRDRFLERLLLHKLGLQMGHLVHAIHEGLKPEAAILIERLGETLRNLTKSFHN